MTVINTNVAATVTANSMKANQRSMETTMERLATGMRVNSAKDDAAGLAIGTKMDSQIRGFEQAVRNANDGISMLQTADGAAEQITGLLQRMRELAVQGQNDTNSTSDLNNLNEEFAALATEVDRIANDTEFNGTALLNSSTSKVITIGADEADTISLTFGDFNLAAGAATTKSVDTLTVTATQIQAIGNDDAAEFNLTDGDGNTLTVSKARVATAGATNWSDATLAEAATAINAAIDADTTFAQMVVTVDGDSLVFTQDAAGTGQIVSAAGKSDATTSLGQIGSGVARTTNAGSDTVSFQIGTNVNQTLSVEFGTLAMTGATGNDLGANFTTALTITTNANANTAMGYVDSAIDAVNTRRATLGAAISRLEHTVDNLENNAVNHAASRSRILDADYAAETTELARTQIIQQAGTAMLSQANQKAQAVLKLLGN
jgi:flagellin